MQDLEAQIVLFDGQAAGLRQVVAADQTGAPTAGFQFGIVFGKTQARIDDRAGAQNGNRGAVGVVELAAHFLWYRIRPLPLVAPELLAGPEVALLGMKPLLQEMAIWLERIISRHNNSLWLIRPEDVVLSILAAVARPSRNRHGKRKKEAKPAKGQIITLTKAQKAKEEASKARYWSGGAVIAVALFYELCKASDPWIGGPKFQDFWQQEAMISTLTFPDTTLFGWVYKCAHPDS